MEEKVLYVGIDVAKAKFDVSITIDGISCIYYQTIENEKGGFKKLVKEIKKIQKKFKIKKVHICMEATGIFLKLFSLKQVAHVGFALVFAMAFANRQSRTQFRFFISFLSKTRSRTSLRASETSVAI